MSLAVWRRFISGMFEARSVIKGLVFSRRREYEWILALDLY